MSKMEAWGCGRHPIQRQQESSNHKIDYIPKNMEMANLEFSHVCAPEWLPLREDSTGGFIMWMLYNGWIFMSMWLIGGGKITCLTSAHACIMNFDSHHLGRQLVAEDWVIFILKPHQQVEMAKQRVHVGGGTCMSFVRSLSSDSPTKTWNNLSNQIRGHLWRHTTEQNHGLILIVKQTRISNRAMPLPSKKQRRFGLFLGFSIDVLGMAKQTAKMSRIDLSFRRCCWCELQGPG